MKTIKQFYILIISVFAATFASDIALAQSPDSTAIIAIVDGYAHKNATQERLPHAHIVELPSVTDALMMIMSGRADYALFDLPVANSVVENNPDMEIIADSTLAVKQLVASFSAKNSALQAEFNLFLKEFKQDFKYKNIIFRWQDGHDEEPPNVPTHDKWRILNVGVDSEVPPYCVSKHGELHGISVEIIKHFALENGYQLNIQDMSAEDIEASLTSQKLDISLTGYTLAKANSNVLYSDPYYSVPVVMVSRIGTLTESVPTETEYSIDNLSRSTIAVAVGSSHDLFVTKYFPNAEIIRVGSSDDVYSRVRSKGVDYGVLDMPVLTDAKSRYSDIDIVEENLFSGDVAIAFSQNDTSLRDDFNTFYRSFMLTPEYDDMVNRWLKDGSGGDIPQIDDIESDKVFILGTYSQSPPYALMIDQEIEGYEIELMRHYAQQRGYKLKIVDMSTNLVVPALESGSVDAVAAGLCITDERERKVLFSAPHQKINAGVFRVTDQVSELNQGLLGGIINSTQLKQIAHGLWVTILISIMSILLGTALGALVLWCSAHRNRALQIFSRGYITIIRGIPVLVLLMLNLYLIFSMTSISPLVVAIITLGISLSADLADKLRRLHGECQTGQISELLSPTKLDSVVTMYKNETVSLIKTTSIVGYFAIEDLTRVNYMIQSETFDAILPLILTTVLYFALAYLFSLLVDVLISHSKRLLKRN